MGNGMGEDCVEVRPHIKKRVNFRELNLTKGFHSLGNFNVIFRRNVLIYFSSILKRDILHGMARLLNPGGYLFIGSTESMAGYSEAFEMLCAKGGIVYRLK